MRFRKLKRFVLIFLMAIFGVVALLFAIINLPFSQKFATRQVNQILEKSNVPIHIHAIKRILPASVKVQGVAITGLSGDTIIYAGELHANCRLLALSRKKVVLRDLDLEQATVYLARNNNTGKINIASAFQSGKQADSPKQKKGKANWEISVKEGELTGITFRMNDAVSGVHIAQDVSAIKLKKFLLSLAERSISAHTLDLSGVDGGIQLSPSEGSVSENNSSPPWTFELLNLIMNHVGFSFHQPANEFKLDVALEKGRIKAKTIDFLSKIIDLRSVSLEKVTSTILTAQKKKEPQEDSSQINNTFQWHILSKALEMESGSVSLGVYKNPGLEAPDSLLTYAGINLDIKDLILHDDRAGIRLKNLGFSMNNGFLLKEMKGELESDKNQTELRMAIETRNSRIHIEGSSEEGLFNMISKPDEIQKARLKIDKSLVSIRDIVYFIPGLSDVPFFESLASGPVNLGGDLLVEGSMFTVSELSIAQGRNYNISLDGFTDYPWQLSKSRGNLDLGITHIDQSWLEALLSGLGFEDSIPDQTGMAVHANISGLFTAPDFAIDIRSHLGSIDMAGSLDFAKDRFALGASFGSLSLGELLSNPQIGSFTGRGEFSGQGLLGDSLRATLSFQVDSFSFHDYSYSQTAIQGELRPGQYSFNIQADDPSLHGELVAIINPLDTVFKVNTKGIISAQLNELRLYKDTLRIESKIESKLLKSEGLLETELIATGLSLATPHDTARVEQLKAIYIMDTLNSMLQTSSDFFNIEMQAAKSIREPGLLVDGFRNYLATFIDSTQVHDSTRTSLLPEFNLAGWMTFHKTLNFFVPDSGFHFDRLDFSLISRPSENRMNYSLTGGGIQYKIVKTDSLNIMITDTAGMINSKLLADKTSIRSGPEYRWEITGNTGGWKALTDLSVRDAMGQIVYGVEVSGILKSKILLLEIPSRQLVLNRSPWQMETPGLLTVDLPGKTVLPDFRMHTDSSMLHLHAIEKEGVISYTLDVDRIYLASLLRKELISGRPEGILSGSIYYSGEENAEKSITTELQIEDITYHDLDLDNINLNGSMTFGPLDAYSIHMMARLDSSRAELNAERKDGGARNMSSSLTLFPLKTIQLFASDHVSDIEGSVSGNFSISSANDIEEYNGELMLADASMRLNLLNSIFRIPDQRVELKNGKMILDQFTILDTLDKKMNVDGYIDFGHKGPAMVDLSVASSKMKVMSRAPKSKATFSGNVFVDSKVSVKGPVTSPVFEGKILLSKGTEIYYQQLDELRQPEAQKVVSFVDNSQARDQNIQPVLTHRYDFMNSSLKTVIEIDPSTAIHFSLSKRLFNIDLDITGGGMVNYNMLKNKQMMLSGVYDISDGSAQLKLTGWPNKSFRIAESGFIRWNGVVDDPELSFSAINRVTSSYVNPVDGKSREVDFDVILQLSNKLSDLDVGFTVQTKDQYIMSILNTMSPEEHMRQAISILLFEIIDLPGISSSNDYMTQQMNQIFAAQLNQLTSNNIPGVELSFRLNSYNQQGTAGAEELTTNLSYEVRKSLLNNRAEIEFSGRLNDVNQQPGASDVSLNNISFEYRLDSASTKYVKIYNEQSYEDVFEGEVIKTGVGLTFRKRYKTLGDIWRRKEK